jgi:hypothetical protein
MPDRSWSEHSSRRAAGSRGYSDAGRLTEQAKALAFAVGQINRADLPNELGALKEMRIRRQKDDREQAAARFSVELQTLREASG